MRCVLLLGGRWEGMMQTACCLPGQTLVGGTTKLPLMKAGGWWCLPGTSYVVPAVPVDLHTKWFHACLQLNMGPCAVRLPLAAVLHPTQGQCDYFGTKTVLPQAVGWAIVVAFGASEFLLYSTCLAGKRGRGGSRHWCVCDFT